MTENTLKYPKPRIALIDVPEEYATQLRDAGYNVSEGSFGLPYRVQSSDRFHPLAYDTCGVPDLEEQEVVVVCNAIPSAEGLMPEHPGEGVSFVGQEGVRGLIDPRPFFMVNCRSKLDRILQAGGLFIVFGANKYQCVYHEAEATRYGLQPSKKIECHNWQFLTKLSYLNIRSANGKEVSFVSSGAAFVSLLRDGFTGGRYSFIFDPPSSQMIPLARNKYREVVAAMFAPDENHKGNVLVLPETGIDPASLLRLIHEWGSTLSPMFFPFHEGANWIHRKEYEIPHVLELQQRITDIQKSARQEVDSLKLEIDKTQQENADWYALLNGTDRDLVTAVIRALEKLGFDNVVDVDAQHDATSNGRNLREDIQVRDQSPTLIVDVKGITGCPQDADATQSEKHALMRSQEEEGKFKPLTIINHERNLPPLDRNPNPYRKEIIKNAEITKLGLMTTWDLFRLLRNKEQLQWPDDVVKPVLYRTGRIEPIPEHYTGIGEIIHVWKERNSIGVILLEKLRVGDRISVYDGAQRFVESSVRSLHVNDKPVDVANPGDKCGIGMGDLPAFFREGLQSFVVNPPSA